MGLTTTPISDDSNSLLNGRGNRASSDENCRSSGEKFVSMSKDEEVDESNTKFVNSVQTTLSEDNAKMGKLQRSFISSTIFTGGFNSVTRVHVIESLDSNVVDDEVEDQVSTLPSMKDVKLNKNHTLSFDHDHRAKDDDGFGLSANDFNHLSNSGEKTRRPLTWKVPVSPVILISYRLLFIIRLVLIGFYLTWRIRHPNHEAMWLWRISNTCEIWFGLSWLFDQLPKLCIVNRVTDIFALNDRFESSNLQNAKGRSSDLPGIDVFITTADPEKEPPLVTVGTILSVLAVDYPVEKLACYLSDDGGSLLTFEAIVETVSFARIWVPFCRKHEIEPRNPEAYFEQKHDFLKNEVRLDFVEEWRRVKREYDELKKRIHSLPETIRRRSDGYNAQEELKAKMKISRATWMSNGSYWPGTWEVLGEADHSRKDHVGIIQVMLASPNVEPIYGSNKDGKNLIDTTNVDIRLPMLVYMSREKRPGYVDNKKAGAMNALLRTSAIMSNGPFILNLDCDHYIYNSLVLKEGLCFMLDKGGDRVGYVQYPQRFDGIDPNDQYGNRNTMFLDVIMRALDGLQGPVYIGTGCIFRRMALYGFSPARATEYHGLFGTRKTKLLLRKSRLLKKEDDDMTIRNNQCNLDCNDDDADIEFLLMPTRIGNSTSLAASIPVAEFQGRLLQELESKGNPGRPAGSLTMPPKPLDVATVAKAISVISSIYEDNTEWGKRVGWFYGCVTEDVLTGYKMHNRGWRSVYCNTKHDGFRGMAPINLTDRLYQVLKWAIGSVEIFFSRNNFLFATRRIQFLQKVAYFNYMIYPFTSFVLVVYCFLPAFSLFSGQFIVQSMGTYLIFELAISITLYLFIILETKWSGLTILDWWQDVQFYLIWGTTAYLAAVLQVLGKVIIGIDVKYTLTSKSTTTTNGDDKFADLYVVKWSFWMIPPITIMLVNMIGIAVGISRALCSPYSEWSKLLGGVFFSLWVLCHFYPFAQGLMGRRVLTWSGLLSVIVLLLCIYLTPSKAQNHIKF